MTSTPPAPADLTTIAALAVAAADAMTRAGYTTPTDAARAPEHVWRMAETRAQAPAPNLALRTAALAVLTAQGRRPACQRSRSRR